MCFYAKRKPNTTTIAHITDTHLGADKRSLFQATITTLQDSGYVISSSDYEGGIISAYTPFMGTTLSASITPQNNGNSRLRININRLVVTNPEVKQLTA